MNLDELQQKLIAAARVAPANDKVPFAFEKRIMAHLRSRRIVEPLAVWSRALWRAVVPCFAVMLLLSAWSWLAPAPTVTTDLSQELENTVLAAVDQDQPVDSTW
jgi:hypothetical protein